ncbi:MAG: lipid-A-disaccharide synthase [Myxococcota bacterium]
MGSGLTSVFVSAIDASADLHAAEWVKELRRLRPGVRVCGAGGVAMEKAGVEIVLPQRELAVAGVVEVLGILPQVISAWRRLERAVREARPGLAVLLDAPDFHLPLAKRLKRQGLPLLYYIGPNVLRWRRGRIHTLARRADRLASIFPFEPDLYRDTSLRVDYVGHPLVEPLRDFARQWDRRTAREALSLDPAAPVVALAPGSRHNELRHMLRPFALAAASMRRRNPRLRFALCVAPTLSREQIVAALPEPPEALGIQLVEGRTREVLVAADAALVKPGSITMEAALLGCPLVVAGRAHPLTAALLRRVVKEPSFAMPNVIAGEPIVPEFLQQDARPEALADAVLALVDGPAGRGQREALAKVRERLGDGAAARHTAAIANEMLAG